MSLKRRVVRDTPWARKGTIYEHKSQGGFESWVPYRGRAVPIFGGPEKLDQWPQFFEHVKDDNVTQLAEFCVSQIGDFKWEDISEQGKEGFLKLAESLIERGFDIGRIKENEEEKEEA